MKSLDTFYTNVFINFTLGEDLNCQNVINLTNFATTTF